MLSKTQPPFYVLPKVSVKTSPVRVMLAACRYRPLMDECPLMYLDSHSLNENISSFTLENKWDVNIVLMSIYRSNTMKLNCFISGTSSNELMNVLVMSFI